MAVTVSGVAVLVRPTLPLELLLAWKVATVLAPFSVVPPTEGAVGVRVVLTRPAPGSLMAPLLVRLMAPAPADTVPVMLTAPVLLTVTLPPPVSLMPLTVNGLALLVRLTLPLELLLALKVPTVLAPFNVVPPTE